MKRIVSLLFLYISPLLFGQNNIQTFIDQKLKNDSDFINSVTGILVVDEEGRTVAHWNENLPLIPASTLKTVTTGVALLKLGPEYKFTTSVGYTGSLGDEGILEGDLYIIGGGDPTLGSRDTVAFPVDSIFGIWSDAVACAGIKAASGRIISDERYFVDEDIPGVWYVEDIGCDYGSAADGLSFCENSSSFEIRPGLFEGDSVEIIPLEPFSPVMTYLNEVVTGPSGSGNKIVYTPSAVSPEGKFTGSYALNRAVDTICVSDKYAHLTCASEFLKYLETKGITVCGISDEAVAGDIDTVCTVFSPELVDIVRVTNRISNNFFAETILKAVGKSLSGKGDRNSAVRAVSHYLDSLNLSTRGLHQTDGSGLSRNNFVSPRFFCDFYGLMEKSPHFEQYLSSFPRPGQDGTLKYFMGRVDPSFKNKVYAKTGSMTGVRCLAGFVKSGEGYLRFAVMVNNYSCPAGRINAAMEGLVYEMAKYAD